MSLRSQTLAARHIQNMSEAKSLEPHWGYADRVTPCTNDPGSCEYLDVVYHSHDVGMLYTGIIWASIGGILLMMGMWYRCVTQTRRSNQVGIQHIEGQKPRSRGSLQRLQSSLSSFRRQWFLPESFKFLFGRTTRLQILILAILVGYLTIWSFAGITYKKWITPIKNSTLHNTRTSLGPFSDRVGVLAYALLPLTVLLSSRESILSIITGIPYQDFNFLHRWIGYVILVQSVVHTIGWSVIEIRLYQPQPKVAKEWIAQTYMVWGVVAQILILFMFVLSLRPIIKITGYEFFRKVHYVLAMVFIGACWGHWQQLKCFLLPSLLLWFLDRSMRLIRTWLIHYNFLPDGGMGFTHAHAQLSHFPDETHGDVVRLDFRYPHNAWKIGQHFYLCFSELGIWQSHPFTPSSLPNEMSQEQSHSYIVRSKRGATRGLAHLARSKARVGPSDTMSTPVILTGPYGEHTIAALDSTSNVLCIAGGTGITYVLPILLHLAGSFASVNRKIELIWAIRKRSDSKWIRRELDILEAAAKSHDIQIRIFVTREDERESASTSEIKSPEAKEIALTSSSSSATSVEEPSKISQPDNLSLMRPDLRSCIMMFIDNTIEGRTIVYGSGPGSMISDLRSVVASCNSSSKVLTGNERFDVDLICDNRLEW